MVFTFHFFLTISSEGYGVSISDCEEIVLYPNEHRNITLFYQPDFTTAQVFLQLKLQTSQVRFFCDCFDVTRVI